MLYMLCKILVDSTVLFYFCVICISSLVFLVCVHKWRILISKVFFNRVRYFLSVFFFFCRRAVDKNRPGLFIHFLSVAPAHYVFVHIMRRAMRSCVPLLKTSHQLNLRVFQGIRRFRCSVWWRFHQTFVLSEWMHLESRRLRRWEQKWPETDLILDRMKTIQQR